MNLDIFKTPKQLYFLQYQHHGEYLDSSFGMMDGNKKYPKIELSHTMRPISELPSDEDLWTIEDNSNIQSKDPKYGWICASNILRSAVAFRSRRAVGNILIVPDQEMHDFFRNNPIFNSTQKCEVLIDSSLAHNELRTAYWKMTGVIDGGIQISPEGFSCLDKDPWGIDYHNYFRRGFIWRE